MRPLAGFFLLCFVVLLLRSTALPALAARGIVLDVLAIATVAWSLRHGEAWGSTFGFLLGMAADLDTAHWLGRHALSLALIGYAVGRLSNTFVRDSARTQLVLVALATALHQGWVSVFDLAEGSADLVFLAARLTVSTLVTSIVGTLVLSVLHRLFGRRTRRHASGSAS